MGKNLGVPPTVDTAGFRQVDLWDEIRYQLPLAYQCGGNTTTITSTTGLHRTILPLEDTKRITPPRQRCCLVDDLSPGRTGQVDSLKIDHLTSFAHAERMKESTRGHRHRAFAAEQAVVEHHQMAADRQGASVIREARAKLLDTIDLQRLGFRQLGSPFYDRLAGELATVILADGPVWSALAPIAGAPFEDAYVLRFFAGVHKRVLDGSAPALAAHFPSTGGDGDAPAAMAAMVELLSECPGAVRDALDVPPQTNEVGRSSALASGLLFIAAETGMPIQLREIGSSGGLNLRLDSYWYEQGGEGWGTEGSPLRFEDLWDGGAPDFSPGAEIVDRRGCDRHPIDATSPLGAQTLLSYVWPEPSERFVRIHHAIEIARKTPVTIDRSDAATWVPQELSKRAEGAALVIMHSVVWQYLEAETARAVAGAIAEGGRAASSDSPLAWLRLEPNPVTYAPAELKVTLWNGSAPQERLLATTSFHGGSMAWQSGH